MLNKLILRDEILKKDNNYRTDIQLVFSTYQNRPVKYLTDKLEETVHRTNLKLCRYFLKRQETRIHFLGFIEGLNSKNLHCHTILKIPPMYSDDDVINKLTYHYRQIEPFGKVYRGSYRPDLYFNNLSYCMKKYHEDTFIYL